MDKTKGHHGKDGGGEGQALTSSQGEDSMPLTIPDGDVAMVDAGDETHPVRETRDKEWDKYVNGILDIQRDLGLSLVGEDVWDKVLDKMMSLRSIYNARWRKGKEPASGITSEKCVQTNESVLGVEESVQTEETVEPGGVALANGPVQVKVELDGDNSGSAQVRSETVWLEDIGDEEEVDVKPQLPGECSLNVEAQERLEGVIPATNQGRSGEPIPGPSSAANAGPSTSSHQPETEVPCSSRSQQFINSALVSHDVIQPEFYERLQLSCRSLGHLSAVYCVLFDVTGKFIFTGADDSLVKIWSAVDGRLLATLRGASSEISDLAVNHANTLLAAGSCDKLIRVWCLRTCAPIAVLNVHSKSVTSLFFCPMPRSRHPVAYLASTSTDSSCSFWGFTENQETRHVKFEPTPTHFQERIKPGPAQIICSSFSSGGIFMASGSADNNVRVYNMLGEEGPERILEAEYHTGRVDSISWAHEGLRFISGSKDGTALVWRFDNGEWRYVRLLCGAKVLGSNMVMVIHEDQKRRPRVTMVAWNLDDTLVLTAVSDSLIKVWNPRNGELIRILEGHNDEVFVIEPHPFNPRIACTAGHDGNIIIWDIGTLNKEDKGKILFQHHNKLDKGQGHGAVFDSKWAPDGLSLAATDSHGHLLIFTTQKKAESKFAKLPGELFFHTDNRPLKRDAETNEVLDEQTQVPPHLMPPPFLVDMEGNPYPPDLQRLVPGRENCTEEELIPAVVIGDRGVQEVIAGLPNLNPGLNYGFPERKLVMPLSKEQLARSEEKRLRFAEMEETLYKENIGRPTSTQSEARRRRAGRLEKEAPEQRRRPPSMLEIEGVARSNPRSPEISERRNVPEVWNGLEEIPLQYRPSEWLAETTPKRTPYFPQIGDEVFYYRQGHQDYIAEVEKQELYEINRKQRKLLPYVAYPQLEASVPARVRKVKFEIKPPRLVTIQLTVQDSVSGEYNGPNLSVTYHDLGNVVDFIILRQIHDKYIRQNWNVGDRFRSLIGSCWWEGTIASIEAKDRDFPDSKFLCYNVMWGNAKSGKLSPWELDIITGSLRKSSSCQAVIASEEDRRIGLYEASPTDWPPHGHQDVQCAKLSRLIQQVMDLAVSQPFLAPFDINRYPEYAFQIEYPMDLSTIKARLDNRFYRRTDSLRFDVQYILMNANEFNLKDTDVVKHARIITDLCKELINNPDVGDVNPVYHQIVQRHAKEAQKKKVASKPSSSSSVATGSTTRSASRSASQPQPSTSRKSVKRTSALGTGQKRKVKRSKISGESLQSHGSNGSGGGHVATDRVGNKRYYDSDEYSYGTSYKERQQTKCDAAQSDSKKIAKMRSKRGAT